VGRSRRDDFDRKRRKKRAPTANVPIPTASRGQPSRSSSVGLAGPLNAITSENTPQNVHSPTDRLVEPEAAPEVEVRGDRKEGTGNQRRDRLLSRAEHRRTMCPPSSWPTGRRLSRVKNIPTQPPITTGCAVSPGSSYAVGCPIRSAIIPKSGGLLNRITVPDALAISAGTRSGSRESPIVSDDDSRDQPAIGPATPMSNRALREGIRPRIRMIAPRVPNGNTNGMTYGSETSTWYRRRRSGRARGSSRRRAPRP